MKHSSIPTAMALTLALAACTPMTPAQSTTTVLGPERSWVLVDQPAAPSALEIVRLFGQRGYPLVDQRRDERGVVLRFRGERTQVSEAVVTPLDVLAAVAGVADLLTRDSQRGDRHHHHHHHHHDDRQQHHEPTIEHYALGSVFYVRIEPRGET
ncbi:MAG: hypothetical protein M3680_14220, partial [Myxococcota bacterium]|nr:hypothetical protein [Myxococcota bacterium]